MERVAWSIYTTICKIDSKWEFAVWHRELNPTLCDHLEEWNVEGDRSEVQEGGEIGITYGWFLLMYGRNQHNIR